MIKDKFVEYCDNLDLTGKNSGKSHVGDIIDHTKAAHSATHAWLVFNLSEPVTAAGAASVRFFLESSDDVTFPSNDTVEIMTTPVYPKPALDIGFYAAVPAPYLYKRYSRVSVEVTGGPLTCGSLSAGYVTSWPEIP